MEYVGAVEYYFYQGLAKGVKMSFNELSNILDNLDVFGNNNVSKACLEAYSDGFAIGTELTEQKYQDLFYIPEEIVEVKKQVDSPTKNVVKSIDEEFETLIKIVGNC